MIKRAVTGYLIQWSASSLQIWYFIPLQLCFPRCSTCVYCLKHTCQIKEQLMHLIFNYCPLHYRAQWGNVKASNPLQASKCCFTLKDEICILKFFPLPKSPVLNLFKFTSFSLLIGQSLWLWTVLILSASLFCWFVLKLDYKMLPPCQLENKQRRLTWLWR